MSGPRFPSSLSFQTQLVLLPGMGARPQRSDSPKRGADLISNRPKYLLAGAGAAVLITLLARAIHTHASWSDLIYVSSSEVISPDVGENIPFHRRGILVCGKPISDCENIDVAD